MGYSRLVVFISSLSQAHQYSFTSSSSQTYYFQSALHNDQNSNICGSSTPNRKKCSLAENKLAYFWLLIVPGQRKKSPSCLTRAKNTDFLISKIIIQLDILILYTNSSIQYTSFFQKLNAHIYKNDIKIGVCIYSSHRMLLYHRLLWNLSKYDFFSVVYPLQAKKLNSVAISFIFHESEPFWRTWEFSVAVVFFLCWGMGINLIRWSWFI